MLGKLGGERRRKESREQRAGETMWGNLRRAMGIYGIYEIQTEQGDTRWGKAQLNLGSNKCEGVNSVA